MDYFSYLFSVLDYYSNAGPRRCSCGFGKLGGGGLPWGVPHSSREQPSGQTLLRKLGVTQDQGLGLQRAQDLKEGGRQGLATLS